MTSPSYASIHQAENAIVDKTTQAILDNIPASGTDLPTFLGGPRDVYLIVTAGASYTDVKVLANPPVNPQALAAGLEMSAARTPLAGETVEWSDDDYTAAHVTHRTAHWGSRFSANLVPMDALLAGLRRAKFIPHPLLRVPRYAQVTGLPSATAGTAHFRWYDGRSLARSRAVVVSSRLRLIDTWPVALLVLIPVLSLVCLFAARRAGSAAGKPLEIRRKRYQSLSRLPLLGAILGMPLMAVLTQSAAGKILADLWFGASSPSIFVLPITLIIIVPFCGALVAAHKGEVKFFGKPDLVKPWLSDEEKTLQKRMRKWSALPHVVGSLVALAVLLVVPHRSAVYPILHPLSQVLILAGAVIVSLLFRKQTAALTRKSVDDELTFRARRFGQLLGARPGQVWVEESSRASCFMGAYREKEHIVVSRKLRDEFSPAEVDFVLAQQIAAMNRPRALINWLLPLAALPLILAPFMLILLHHPSSGPTGLFLSPWFFPAMFLFPILSVMLLLLAARRAAKDVPTQECEADTRALGATRDLAAALAAVSKLETLPPNLSASTVSSSWNALAQTAHRAQRCAALEKAGCELRLSAVAGAVSSSM